MHIIYPYHVIQTSYTIDQLQFVSVLSASNHSYTRSQLLLTRRQQLKLSSTPIFHIIYYIQTASQLPSKKFPPPRDIGTTKKTATFRDSQNRDHTTTMELQVDHQQPSDQAVARANKRSVLVASD